jgi:hypothetical protein
MNTLLTAVGKGGIVNKSNKILATCILLLVALPSFAFSIQDKAPDLPNRSTVINIQNVSGVQISILLSSGKELKVMKNEGRLIPCSDISGVMMYVKGKMGNNSSELRCGHTYIIGGSEK